MAAYREVARYASLLFLVWQTLLLIDFGYRTNEQFVEWDEQSEGESMFSWKLCLLVGAALLYGGSIAVWVLSSQWYGMDGCSGPQALIAITIIATLSLSLVSCTKIAPHGTLFTSAVVTADASYLLYSALSSSPDPTCNPFDHGAAPDVLVGILVAAVSMGAFAWSATNQKDAILGKASANSELTVTLEAGSASDAPADADDERAVSPESWWTYHLMMVIVALYMAMLLSDWSVEPVEKHAAGGSSVPAFNKSAESFWVKIASQWVCLLMYAWTLLAPYLLRDVRDFGIEFDF